MRLHQNISALAGIALVLFVGIASQWGSLQRAQTADDLRLLSTLGITVDDFCGGKLHPHDHCPLCRLDDEAGPLPAAAWAYTVLDSQQLPDQRIIAWVFPRSNPLSAQPRAPPALA